MKGGILRYIGRGMYDETDAKMNNGLKVYPLLSIVRSIFPLVLSALFAATLCGQDIDFQKEILPIFKEHCFECHGNGESKGGLSLESVAGLQQGGDSGSPIFTPKASDSELYLRIRSLAEGYRMPKRGEPLPQAKISKISKWIFQNKDLENAKPSPSELKVQTPVATTPNVDTKSTNSNPTSSSPIVSTPISSTPTSTVPNRDRAKRVVGAASETEGFLRDFGISPLLMVVASTAFISFLLCWILYRMVLQSSRRNRRRIQSNEELTASFFAILIGAISAVMLVSLVFLYLRASQLTLENELLRSGNGSQTTNASDFGAAPIVSVDANNLPLPPHPMHPPRLGGKYYRGNDERDEALFNGGFYRTATIDLNLVSNWGSQVRWGDSAEKPLFVEIKIRRAPKATRELFTNRIAELSSIEHYSQSPGGAEKKLKFKVLEEDDLWSVKVPLADLSQQTGQKKHLEGMIYLMYGTQPSEDQLPRPHFGVKYDLHFEAGKIGSDSVLWMGSMYTLNNRVLVPNSEQVLLDRWFDWRPIPEIEGDPSDDASLLGTNEHLSP